MFDLYGVFEGLTKSSTSTLSRDEIESLVKEMLREISKQAYKLGSANLKVTGTSTLKSLSSVTLCQYTYSGKDASERNSAVAKLKSQLKSIINKYEKRGLSGSLTVSGPGRVGTATYKVNLPKED